jgi:hypothetical protein
MEGVFQRGQESVGHDEEVVVLLQEVLAVGGAELEFVSGAWSAGEAVEVASALAVFGDFEIGEGLGLGHEYNFNAAAIGAETELAFDGALERAVYVDHEDAAQFCVEDAFDGEGVILEILF